MPTHRVEIAAPQRSLSIRSGNDIRSITDRPFVLAYECPPEDGRVGYDVMGDATGPEMIRLCASIARMLVKQGLYFQTRAELERVLAEEGLTIDGIAVKQPVQRAPESGIEDGDHESARVA